MKGIITIFNLKGEVDIWWEDLRNLKNIREKEISWRKFEKYFWDFTCWKGTMIGKLNNSMSIS